MSAPRIAALRLRRNTVRVANRLEYGEEGYVFKSPKEAFRAVYARVRAERRGNGRPLWWHSLGVSRPFNPKVPDPTGR